MDLMWTCKPVKKWKVAVHVSKDKNDPKRILGGNNQLHPIRDAEDAPYPKTEATDNGTQQSNGRMSITPEKWMGIRKFCVYVILTI